MPRKKKPQRRLNGEGSIRQRKDLRWEYRYTEYDPITCKTERKSYIEKNEEEFYDKVYEIKGKLRKGKATEPCKIPLWDWVYEWLHTYKPKNLKATTFDSYELTAQKHLKDDPIGKIPIGKLKTEDLQKFYDRMLKDQGKQWAECQNKDCKAIIDDKELIEKFKRQHVKSRHCPKCKGPVLIKKGIGIRTVHYLRTQIIGGALRKAKSTHKIEYDENEGTEIPKLEYKETEPFSAEQIQDFLRIIEKDNFGLAIKLDVSTGLRLGELISLKWPDINKEQNTIKITRTVARVRRNKVEDAKDLIEILETGKPDSKTVLIYQKPKTKMSESEIPIPLKLIPLLEQHRDGQKVTKMKNRNIYKDNDLVFCNDTGTQIDPKNFREHYQILLCKAGLPRNTFHALRHTFGALLLELGEDMKIIQELMRHEHYDTTADTYVKVAKKLKQKAASKMNALL